MASTSLMLVDLFRKILCPASLCDKRETSRLNLQSFLAKGTGYLKAFPLTFVPVAGNSDKEVEEKKALIYWLVRRLLYVWTCDPDVPPNFSTDILECSLRLVQQRDPPFFAELMRKYLDLLTECLKKSDLLFNGDSRVQIELKSFDGSDDDRDLLPLTFDDGEVLERFQCKLTSLLANFAAAGVRYLPDAIPSLVWEAGCRQLELGGLQLKLSSLVMLRGLVNTGEYPTTVKQSAYYFDNLFSLVRYLCSDSEDEEEVGDVLGSLAKELDFAIHDLLNADLGEINSKVFAAEITACWEYFSCRQNFINMKKHLSEDLCHTLSDCLTYCLDKEDAPKMRLDLILQLLCEEIKEENVEALSGIIWSEMKATIDGVLKVAAEKRKGMRKSDPNKTIQQETLLNAGKESKSWSQMVQSLVTLLATQDDIYGLLEHVVRIARQVTKKVEKRDCNGIVHLDFLPREIVMQAVNEMVKQVVQQNSASVLSFLLPRIIFILSDLLYIQPLETMTQGLLQQCVALASLPWMSGEMKLQDLRLGDRLTNALITASAKVEPKSDDALIAIRIVASLQKEVCPNWRIHTLRKIWSNGNPKLRQSILENMPLMLQTLGPAALPLSKNIIVEALEKGDRNEVMALSKVAGLLLCVQARQGYLIRQSGKVFVQCLKCHRGKSLLKSDEYLRQQDVEHLLKLVGYNDAEVKTNAICLIRPLSNHVGFTTVSANLWMNYFEESSDQCFMKFCQHVKYFFGPAVMVDGVPSDTADHSHLPGWSDQNSVCDTLLQNIKETCETAKTSRDSLFVNATCLMLTSVGLTSVARVQEPVMLFMIDLLMTPTTHVQLYFYGAGYMKTKLQCYKGLIMSQIAKRLCDGRPMREVLDSATILFSSVNVKRFVTQNMHHLLPPLVLMCAEGNKTDPIEFVASLNDQKKYRHVLADNFRHIMPYVVTQAANKTEYNKCLAYLEKETNLKLTTQLLPSNRQRVITELMLSFHAHYDRVLGALKWLALNDEEFVARNRKGVKEKRPVSNVELIDYLGPKFLGVLGYFDQRLINPSVPDLAKQETLRSLRDIIQFMGAKKIANVKHKLMATFKTATGLNLSTVGGLLLPLWNTFVMTMEVQSIGPILGQVIANVYPMSESGFREEVLKIYRYLLVEKENELKDYFDGICFIPEYFTEINQVVNKKNKIASETPFAQILHCVVKSITSENSEVKLMTLQKLQELLGLNQGRLQGLVLSSDQADPVISHLVNLLVNATRDSDLAVVRLAGHCLGLVGAVDPGRLEHNQDLAGGLGSVSISVQEEGFILNLLRTLVRAFLKSAEATDSDACAYSLQEVLKTYKITGDRSMSTLGQNVWSQCSDSEKEILTPFLTSLYSRSDKTGAHAVPIYKSKESMSYHDWLGNWCFHLIGTVRLPQEQSVYVACKAAIWKDDVCAQFLLPYIITSVLCNDDPKNTPDILAEINAVLEAEATKQRTTSSAPGCVPSLLGQQQHSQYMDLERLAIQTVFAIIDHLNLWLRKRYLIVEAEAKSRRGGGVAQAVAKDKEYAAVKAFLKTVCQKKLADASFHCQAYARALMHLENHLRENPDELQPSLFKLQQIYGALQDADYVIGVSALRKVEATLEERMFCHQVTGNFQDALGCYEGFGKNQDSSTVMKSVLECYLCMDQPHTAAMLAQGLTSSNPESEDVLKQYRMEAAWHLSQWDTIEQETEHGSTVNRGWRHNLADLLLTLHSRDQPEFNRRLEAMLTNEVSPISAAAMEQGCYQRSYRHVVHLQIINEVQRLADAVLLKDSPVAAIQDLKEIFDTWNTRNTFTQGSLDSCEPVLRVRRCLLNIAIKRPLEGQEDIRDLMRRELGRCVLESAKVARKNGQFNKAFNLLVEVEQYRDTELFIERATLNWARGHRDESIAILKKGIAENFPWWHSNFDPKTNTSHSMDDLTVCASAKLLLARYVDESANLDADSVPKFYKEAIRLSERSEEPLYHSARFLDKTVDRHYKQKGDVGVIGDLICQVIRQYGASLQYGCNHIDQSLPRMLTLWFDYGSRVTNKATSQQNNAKLAAEMQSCLEKMNKFMSHFASKYPPYYFLVVFPQLTSRICHANQEVWHILRRILVTTFVKYPQQVFWHMIALSKSSYDKRRERCAEIFNRGVEEASHDNNERFKLQKFLTDGKSLADKLHRLAEEKVDPGRCLLKDIMPDLPSMLRNGFSLITVPTTRNMSVMLPTDDVDKETFNELPANAPHFFKVEDTIVIMKSLVSPKKVTFTGSDGRKYSFLCKPKDDLRKDCRLIDFNNLLNKLFMKDSDCRQRDLRIRTYKVVPLNETSGIIEWVDNLSPLRTILSKLYREKFGINPLSGSEMSKFITREDDATLNRRNYDQLIARHPPVFAEWFVSTFPDPQTWFMARIGYTRTTAVMSMVGYLLGLGDRHAENIMFDSSNGDTVHVDLNCIFNKGDTLKIPEVVPFRLTKNMVQAMGPTGYEGPFRIACEKSLGLMREQKDLLMTALRPFYFDPLVDWVQSSGGQKSGHGGEIVNEKAVETLKAIEERLDGLVLNNIAKKKKAAAAAKSLKVGGGGIIHTTLPLSVSGQVDYLINEATSNDNLSQMYHGWTPYY